MVYFYLREFVGYYSKERELVDLNGSVIYKMDRELDSFRNRWGYFFFVILVGNCGKFRCSRS